MNAGIEIAGGRSCSGPSSRRKDWDNSPFNLYSAKGRYMWRDLERTCAAEELRFRRPDPFPQAEPEAAAGWR